MCTKQWCTALPKACCTLFLPTAVVFSSSQCHYWCCNSLVCLSVSLICLSPFLSLSLSPVTPYTEPFWAQYWRLYMCHLHVNTCTHTSTHSPTTVLVPNQYGQTAPSQHPAPACAPVVASCPAACAARSPFPPPPPLTRLQRGHTGHNPAPEAYQRRQAAA